MSEQQQIDVRGWRCKFHVRRADGTHRRGLKHHGCEYFVLDLTHDPDAWAAVLVYANAVRGSRPVLSGDLMEMYFRWQETKP